MTSNSKGDGLVLFWKSSINLTVQGSSKYFIDSYIDKNTKNAWHFTGFYGEPDIAKRWEVWNDLCSLIYPPNTPWICAGEFNKITKQSEKMGGAL